MGSHVARLMHKESEEVDGTKEAVVPRSEDGDGNCKQRMVDRL